MRDPYFDDIPWEFVTDDSGTVVGTVYTLLSNPDPRRVKQTWDTGSTLHRTNMQKLQKSE